jgi:protein-tyrosine kinase
MTLVEDAMEKLRRPGVAPPAQPVAIGSVQDVLSEESRATRIVAINANSLRDAGYMPETGTDRRFADEYRQIKRPLIAKALAAGEPAAGNARLIMMASALPGDGKTFTSINLALSMARERDISVLLVDSDTPKPHVSRIFGVENEPGLLEALADPGIDIESLVLRTDLKGLSILSAGQPNEGATELLSSVHMATVVTRLIAQNSRRIVLFDSPPLLVSSESRALVSIAGQVVLVVRAGATPTQAVQDAIGHIGADKSVSLVLNEGRARLTSGYYGYGDYGNYGSSP